VPSLDVVEALVVALGHDRQRHVVATPSSGCFAIIQSMTPSSTRPTSSVFVSAIGTSRNPASSTQCVPVISPLPLRSKNAAATRLVHGSAFGSTTVTPVRTGPRPGYERPHRALDLRDLADQTPATSVIASFFPAGRVPIVIPGVRATPGSGRGEQRSERKARRGAERHAAAFSTWALARHAGVPMAPAENCGHGKRIFPARQQRRDRRRRGLHWRPQPCCGGRNRSRCRLRSARCSSSRASTRRTATLLARAPYRRTDSSMACSAGCTTTITSSRRLDLLFLPPWALVSDAGRVRGAVCGADADKRHRRLARDGEPARLALLRVGPLRRAHSVQAAITPYGRWIKKYHLWHHFKNEQLWFGVTNPSMDYVVGTYLDVADAERSGSTRFLYN
jgi:hypothetical protein